jgi:hypothetical protein
MHFEPEPPETQITSRTDLPVPPAGHTLTCFVYRKECSGPAVLQHRQCG